MKPILPTLCLLTCTLCGCVATAPEWEARFGDAARQASAAQVIDPNAPTRNGKPALVDGKAVAGAQTGYASSYGYAVKETKQPSLTVAPSGR